jgi:hypothetical protein
VGVSWRLFIAVYFIFFLSEVPKSFADLPFQSNDVPFPHTSATNGASGIGAPFVASQGGPLIDSVIDDFAHFPIMILPGTPIADARKDITPAIRAKNPKAKIFGYVVASTMWCGVVYDQSTYFRHYWNFVNAIGGGDPNSCTFGGDAWLYMQDGTLAGNLYTINVNLAKRVLQPDNTYKYPVAEGIADIIYNDVYLALDANGRKIFDGIFFDVYCESLSWMEGYTPSTKFDYKRAGYGNDNSLTANHDAFMAGWTAGFTALANRIRSRIGDNDYPVIGNCGIGTLYSQLNGWVREDFPFQDGGTWLTNMFRQTGGYLLGDLNFRNPQYNYLFSGANPIPYSGPSPAPTPTYDPYTAANRQKERFGLGSASLGDGFAAFGPSSGNPNDGQHFFWFYDEYAVDLLTGFASTAIKDLGWLGNATSRQYQMVWLGSSAELISNNEFESDTSSWLFRSFAPSVATMVRETTGAPEGSADVHINITQLGTSSWYTNIANASTFSLGSYVPYSITFWAKASSARAIEGVVTRTSDNLILGEQSIPITTEWKQYQMVFTPTALGSANMRFDVGQALGDIWFDDIHVRQGANNIYRRDFAHGIVLVNPDGQSKTVPLEKEFRKIKGTVSPDINNGDGTTTITSVQVGANDAVFLLNKKTIAPTAPNGVKVREQ